MSHKHEFVHRFEDYSSDVLSMDKEATGDERIKVELEDGSKVWLTANREGWLHLARLCAELGMADCRDGYHFHLTFDFQGSDGSGPEISFALDENL